MSSFRDFCVLYQVRFIDIYLYVLEIPIFSTPGCDFETLWHSGSLFFFKDGAIQTKAKADRRRERKKSSTFVFTWLEVSLPEPLPFKTDRHTHLPSRPKATHWIDWTGCD